MYVRRTARVVMFNPEGAVLLVRSRFRRSIPGLEWAWFVPGGGVHAGETLREAAIREIAEETGIDISRQELVHLAFAGGDGTVGELTGPMRDDVFAATAPTTQIATDKMEASELNALDRYKWWHIADLQQTTETVFPNGLADVLQEFATANEWLKPHSLPW